MADVASPAAAVAVAAARAIIARKASGVGAIVDGDCLIMVYGKVMLTLQQESIVERMN